MSKQIDALIAVALAEEGYLEKRSASQLDDKTANAGSANFTKYARDLIANREIVPNPYSQGAPWCDMLVDWCFIQAFGTAEAKRLLLGWSAYTPTSASYFDKAGRWHDEPQPGDIIFFRNSTRIYHTGVVYKVDASYVYTIEGNTSAGVAVVANGGGVCKKFYSRKNVNIAGYGRPDYKEDKVELPEFKQLYNAMRAELRDNDSSGYSEEARKWAVDSGLVGGGGNGADGKPNYMWEDLLTREQLVTVLYRFAQMMGKA